MVSAKMFTWSVKRNQTIWVKNSLISVYLPYLRVLQGNLRNRKGFKKFIWYSSIRFILCQIVLGCFKYLKGRRIECKLLLSKIQKLNLNYNGLNL